MDAATYAELQTRIACGELDCLKNCCDADSLLMLRDLLSGKSQKDLGILAKMLCGCATPKAPSTPQVDNGAKCIEKIASWVRENRVTLTLLQTTLDVAEGLVGDPKVALAIGALSSSLEAIEDLAISREGTIADEVIEHACAISNTTNEVVAGIKDLAPEFVKPALTLLQKLDGITSLGCCPDAVVTKLPTIDESDIPISLPEFPLEETQGYPSGYGSQTAAVRPFNPNNIE